MENVINKIYKMKQESKGARQKHPDREWLEGLQWEGEGCKGGKNILFSVNPIKIENVLPHSRNFK